MNTFFKLAIALLFFTLLSCNSALSQEKGLASQENKFVSLYAKLFSFIQVDYDSISYYSEKFEDEFSSFIKNNPSTLNYPFQKLTANNFLFIRTSNDGKFRIYSWDTWKGGSMHIFREIYQWSGKGKVYTEIPKHEELDPGSFCSKIYTVYISGKPYYLAVTNAIFSNKDMNQSISAYSIEGQKLVDTVKVFKTKREQLNSIDVDFDFFSVVDRPERPLELITYDEKHKIIYIPVVDEKGQVSKKKLLYSLKGNHFEFIGIKTGK